MKIGPYLLSAAKCRPVSLVSGSIRFMQILVGVSWREASDDSGVVESGDFQCLQSLYLWNEDKKFCFFFRLYV